MKRPSLTRCEAEVMDVVWGRDQATVQDVVAALPRSLAYTTVMTTMRILEDKQVLQRCGRRGRAYVYRPCVSRQEVRRSMASELSERLFGGSVKSLVLSLVQSDSISKADLEELKAAIRTLEEQA